jgi:hypothetical protein
MTETTVLPADFEINERTLADPAYAPVLAFIEAHVNELRFTALPEDVLEGDGAEYFYVTVQMKSPGNWAVMKRGEVLNRDGEWEWEPQNSSRTPAFLKNTRYPLAEAVALAKAATKDVKLMHYTVESFTERIRSLQADNA